MNSRYVNFLGNDFLSEDKKDLKLCELKEASHCT